MLMNAVRFDRAVVFAAVVLTAALFTAEAADPVNVIKLTALLLCVVALVVSAAYQVVRAREIDLPWGLPALVAVILAGALVVSTVAAPVTTTAVLGAYGRNSGLLAYLGGVVLLLVCLRVFRGPAGGVLVGAVVVAALFTATYGLLQRIGWDTVPWNNPFNPIIASLGNPNFAAGYLGIGASVAIGGALWSGWGRGCRAACGLTGALCLLAGGLSSSVQAPVSAAGGLFVLAVAVVLGQPSKRRRAGLLSLGAVAVTGVACLLVGVLTKGGPAGPLFQDNGSRARYFYWDAAMAMFGDRPVVGVGLDQYGAFWRSARSAESAAVLGGPSFSDAAHSVPLQMLAQGGLVLGLAYLALVVVVLNALVRGLVRLQGQDRMLLAALGAGWAAYQVQASVSIDQVPLLVLHFVLAGGVVAASGTGRLRHVRLPGVPKPVVVHPNDARTKRRTAAAAAPQVRSTSGVDAVLLASVGAVALFAAFQSLTPLRANVAVSNGDTALASGDGQAALDAYDQALELVPGQSNYWIKRGALFERLSPPAPLQAEQAYLQAVEVDPYEANALNSAARLAEANGDIEQARGLFRQAADVDRWNEDTLEPAARFELRHEGAEAARDLLEDAVIRLPELPRLWAALGDARAALGDEQAARAAYDRALGLDPAQPAAQAGLAALAP